MCGQNLIRGDRLGVFEFRGILACQVSYHADREDLRPVDGDAEYHRAFAPVTVGVHQQASAVKRFFLTGINDPGLVGGVPMPANRTAQNIRQPLDNFVKIELWHLVCV